MDLKTRTTPREALRDGRVHRLVVVHAPEARRVGQMLLVGEGRTVIGRPGGDGQWFLHDDEVSRTHAVLEVRDGEQPQLQDLGSHNGTFLNGECLRGPVALHAGDVVRMGGHLLAFQELDVRQCELLLSARLEPVEGHVATDPAMLPVLDAVSTAARFAGPSLVTGPSGAGKELLARAIHVRSGRVGPYLTVNCAALPEGLAEHELFGHRKGAFTGAAGDTGGLFGDAEGGTLFLDEIGDMPFALQAKLLRALATGEVRPVGTTRARAVNVKVVAATNVDLEQACRDGRFRGDLYARLMGSQVAVPPLASRRADVLPLARHFLGLAGASGHMDANAAEALLLHDWPYNVRELEQYMSQCAARDVAGDVLGVEALPPILKARLARRFVTEAMANEVSLLDVARDRAPDKVGLQKALAHFQGNMGQVAAFFAKDRRQVYRWAEQHDLDPTDYRHT